MCSAVPGSFGRHVGSRCKFIQGAILAFFVSATRSSLAWRM